MPASLLQIARSDRLVARLRCSLASCLMSYDADPAAVRGDIGPALAAQIAPVRIAAVANGRLGRGGCGVRPAYERGP
jgi:hypothetical protein